MSANPTPSTSPVSRITRTPEGHVYTGDKLTYRITGLTSYNLERLRVTLKASTAQDPHTFHIDNLDLYSSRMRETYAEACAKHLADVEQGAVQQELTALRAYPKTPATLHAI
jgi:hypothetical protein